MTFPSPATVSQAQPLPPYLGARAHLSLSWLSQTLLSILLALAPIALLISTIPDLVSDAKVTLLSSCDGVERAADVMVSLPHYMAEGLNRLNVQTVKAVTNDMSASLDLLLLAVQEIVIFMIEMYLGLYLCLLDLAVHGGLTLVIDAAQEAEGFITSAFQDVRSEVQSAVGDINTAISKTVSVVDDIPGVDISAPQFSVPNLTALENVTFSPSFLSGLEALNASIPSYEGLKADLEALISTPVSVLRTEIGATLGNATLAVELLPVPAASSVGLCNSLDTSFVDRVGHELAASLKIALGLLILALFLLAGVSLLGEKWRWRRYLDGVGRAKAAWQADAAQGADMLALPSLLAFLSAAQSPTVSYYLARLANKLKLSPTQRSNLHWFVSYILHPWALIFLVLGVVGLVVVEIQLAALDGPVKAAAQGEAQTGVTDFAGSVVSLINDNMNRTSTQYANDTNAVFQSFADGINGDLFEWVNTTTTALNTTLVTFYDELTGSITAIFNGTMLEDPALDLVYCLLGSKLNSLESALAYLNSHLRLTLPAVSADVLMLSSNQTQELTSSLTSENLTLSSASVVDTMIASYARTLRSQRLGFILCIAIWAAVLVMGIVGLWWRTREVRRARARLDGLRPLSLRGDGGKGGSFEFKTISDEKRSVLPHSPPASPGPNPPRSTLAAYLARLSAVFGEAMNNRPHTGTAPNRSDVGSSSTPPARATSFTALRSRVPRPAPAFSAVRNAVTNVLPAATGSSSAVSQPLVKPTWDPPTSPQRQEGAEGDPRARWPDWLTASSPPLSLTRERVPPTSAGEGWQSLPSPAQLQHVDPFADSGALVDGQTSDVPDCCHPLGGAHPSAATPDKVTGDRREHQSPTVPVGVRRPEANPFATPFDGEGEQ